MLLIMTLNEEIKLKGGGGRDLIHFRNEAGFVVSERESKSSLYSVLGPPLPNSLAA